MQHDQNESQLIYVLKHKKLNVSLNVLVCPSVLFSLSVSVASDGISKAYLHIVAAQSLNSVSEFNRFTLDKRYDYGAYFII